VNTGFGQGESGPAGDPLARRQEVQATGFGAAAPQVPAPKKVAVEVPVLTPVEILAKPKPLYTAEARSLKIEGRVTLEVVFGATGQVRVVRVVRGLGHGLDETAAAAAEQIRFKPATENGQPVDFRAIVHILFQLAY
jgi:TonB family protein